MIKFTILLPLFLFVIVVKSNSPIFVKEIPVEPPFKVGFGGVWDARISSSYFVDHYSNYCYRYSLIENRMYRAAVETNFTISFIFPSRDDVNIFFVGAGNTIILVEWDGLTDTAHFIKLVCEVEPNTGNIMNHAVAGPLGELVFGTFGGKLCSANATQGLYQYKKSKSHSDVKVLFMDVQITSGVAIDEKCNILYHLDGCSQELTAYDRDYYTGDLSTVISWGILLPRCETICKWWQGDYHATNTVCNRRYKACVKEHISGETRWNFRDVVPNLIENLMVPSANKRVVIKFNFATSVLTVGLVIDKNGYLYTGLYGGSALVRMAPKTRTYRLIEMPTPFVSDPGFGGRSNDLFFVATGTVIPYFSTGQLNTTIDTPLAGSVLQVYGLEAKSNRTNLPAA